ncbi:MAG TPA: NAD(P)/FAD-dependent oxidoreductase [Nitrospiraceae bacterium]|nr:NAD(P)/FAD-dependent oxidoreductase [Nitrospiraceae bacterium]
MTSKSILIVGGGIAGPALALFLKRKGFFPVIYEARRRDDKSGGGLGLAPNGMSILAELGLANKVRAAGNTYKGFEFYNSDGVLLSSYQDQKRDINEEYGVALPRQSLHEILLDAMSAEGIPIHFEKRLAMVDTVNGEPVCRFAYGDSVPCHLVIGADGLVSTVRHIIFPDVHPSYTGLIGIGGFVTENVIGKEYLPPDDRMRMFFGKLGFFGIARSGLESGKQQVMWWSALPDEDSDRENVSKLTEEDKRAMLIQLHRGWCPPTERIIKSAKNIWAGNLYDIPNLEKWHVGNVCLMGDAAHAVSPHSGQGASMALEDAWCLPRCLIRHPSEPQDAFAEFQDARKCRVDKVIAYGRRSGNLKKELTPVEIWIRDKFLIFLLPLFARRVAKWMYRGLPDQEK